MTVLTSGLFGPASLHQMFTGVEVPDPVTFVMSSKWLNRPQMYPRQATLLKLVFLRDDLFTDYDREVIEEWRTGFDPENNPEGVAPDIYERIAWMKERHYSWFREVLLAIGRRGGKGYLSALIYAYILWTYMSRGDPQDYYGIAPGKQLTALIFAGKKEQAVKNLWGDINSVITTAPCFQPFISRAQTESLTIFAPADYLRLYELQRQGIMPVKDQATFLIDPKESTPLAGRGPASFALGFDEMAHVVKAVAKSDASDVYEAANPSLDQFGRDAIMIAPSSTWEMTGKYYELCQQALEKTDEGAPAYPNKLLVQLPSWGPYEDWERAYALPALPQGFLGDLGEYADTPPGQAPLYFLPLRGAIQAYDEEMAQQERANPDTFRVERRSHWATALDAYLNPQKVEAIFAPWYDRPEHYGRPQLEMQTSGPLIVTYKAHGDPSSVNCRFGFAVAHEELAPQLDENGEPKVDPKTGKPIIVAHAVFDVIHHWDPADYPDHTIDYDDVIDWIWNSVVMKFYPEELTFDQFNNIATVQRLQHKVRNSPQLPKRVQVFEKTATAALNWSRAEVFKAAINMGLVHAPQYDPVKEELLFIKKPEGVNRIEPPTTGPVQTKDIADCLMECTYVLLGEQMNNFLAKDLRLASLGGGMQGGVDPLNRLSQDHATPQEALSGFTRARGGRPGIGRGMPTRGGPMGRRGFSRRR